MARKLANGNADIVVIGAGIAGVSAAAELAASASVLLLEAEAQPGYHATGRSAAFFAASYGNDVVRGITRAAESFFRNPPTGFTDTDLLHPRDCLFVGRDDQAGAIDALRDEVTALEAISPEAARETVPIFRPGYPGHVLKDATGGDIDVDALLQGYLRRFRSRGGHLASQCHVRQLHYRDGEWWVDCDNRVFRAPIIVNAAGAWADELARKANLDCLGIVPMRRTACLLDAPPGHDISRWPLVVDADEAFYFKPDAGALLASPADETASPPCDAQADELDIALAIDRIQKVLELDVRKVNHRWAGLRSFAPDRTFVAGFDPRCTGFFWLAGQGGYGVQSAPGLANLCAHLVTGASLTDNFAGLDRFSEQVAVERLLPV